MGRERSQFDGKSNPLGSGVLTANRVASGHLSSTLAKGVCCARELDLEQAASHLDVRKSERCQSDPFHVRIMASDPDIDVKRNSLLTVAALRRDRGTATRMKKAKVCSVSTLRGFFIRFIRCVVLFQRSVVMRRANPGV